MRAPARAQEGRMACRARLKNTGSRPTAAVAAPPSHRSARSGQPGTEVTWSVRRGAPRARAARSSPGGWPRPPGRPVGAGRAGRRCPRAQPPPPALPPARLALHPPAAPRPRRAASAGPRRRRRGAARRDSKVGEGGRGRRRLLLHDCLPGCIVGV